MVRDAVQGLLNPKPGMKDNTTKWKLKAMLDFIDWMKDSNSLTKPGVYVSQLSPYGLNLSVTRRPEQLTLTADSSQIVEILLTGLRPRCTVLW